MQHKPSPSGEGVTEGDGCGVVVHLSPHQSKIKDFCQLLPKEKPRAVLQSAADFPITMLAGGKHTAIKEEAGPYILKFNLGDKLGVVDLLIYQPQRRAMWSSAPTVTFYDLAEILSLFYRKFIGKYLTFFSAFDMI